MYAFSKHLNTIRIFGPPVKINVDHFCKNILHETLSLWYGIIDNLYLKTYERTFKIWIFLFLFYGLICWYTSNILFSPYERFDDVKNVWMSRMLRLSLRSFWAIVRLTWRWIFARSFWLSITFKFKRW